jgi:hypothetical protein
MLFNTRTLGSLSNNRTNASLGKKRRSRARRPFVDALEGRAMLSLIVAAEVDETAATNYYSDKITLTDPSNNPEDYNHSTSYSDSQISQMASTSLTSTFDSTDEGDLKGDITLSNSSQETNPGFVGDLRDQAGSTSKLNFSNFSIGGTLTLTYTVQSSGNQQDGPTLQPYPNDSFSAFEYELDGKLAQLTKNGSGTLALPVVASDYVSIFNFNGWGSSDYHLDASISAQIHWEFTSPQITMTDLQWNKNGGGVNFSYQVENGPLPDGSSVDFYWATGPDEQDKLGGQVFSSPASGLSTDSYGPYIVKPSDLDAPPDDATYLLAVAHAGLPNAQTDSVESLAVTNVQTQFDNGDLLHKLLYAKQQLAVNVSVTNKSMQTVQGTEVFYLSLDQDDSVQDDIPLTVNGNVSLNLQPGQTVSLPHIPSVLNVVIPDDIEPGDYYLKATFQESDESLHPVAVSPGLSVCVNSKGQASSFSTYPQNESIFDNAVDVVKQGNPPIPKIHSVKDIETFIESNEAPQKNFYSPYSDTGVPAIGFGSDLKDKTTGAVNVAYEAIINAYLKAHPKLHLTFQDYLHLNPKAQIDKATAIKLFDSGFQVAQKYVKHTYSDLTLDQEAALIDVAYNIGTAGLKKFTSMNKDIDDGSPFGFACAGLELINSERTTQIPLSRTRADFYLLTNSPEIADQL